MPTMAVRNPKETHRHNRYSKQDHVKVTMNKLHHEKKRISLQWFKGMRYKSCTYK